MHALTRVNKYNIYTPCLGHFSPRLYRLMCFSNSFNYVLKKYSQVQSKLQAEQSEAERGIHTAPIIDTFCPYLQNLTVLLSVRDLEAFHKSSKLCQFFLSLFFINWGWGRAIFSHISQISIDLPLQNGLNLTRSLHFLKFKVCGLKLCIVDQKKQHILNKSNKRF